MDARVTLALGGIIVGLLVGSFLNVCISRLPNRRSVVSPGSHCEACGQSLRWYDNIPLLSFVLLRGKCRSCGVSIGFRHPLVELSTAIWFAAGALAFAHAPELWSDSFFRLLVQQVSFCTLGALLIALCVTDWIWHRLPDALTLPGLLFSFLLICTDAMFLRADEYNLILHRKVNLNAAGSGRNTGNIFMTGPEHLIYGRLLAVILCFLLLYSIRVVYRMVRRRDGMGPGDAKLLAMIAGFLGFAPAMLALFVGTLTASAYGVVLLLRGRANAGTRLPFGSFLAVGGLLAAFVGGPLVQWYLGLLRP